MNARERFEKTRRSIKRLNEVKSLIMLGGDDWRPPHIKAKTDASDPTANTAIYRVDVAGDMLDELRREESELENFIGVSLALIAAVRVGFGEIYAYLLEWRYIDGLTWKQVHEEHGTLCAAGKYLVGIAFDWIDSVGVSRLLNDDYEV